MKVYDCFTFNNELDLLEMRLRYYWDDVDYFVLVESGTSFSKKSKRLHYEENKGRFKWAESKIRHIIHKPNLQLAGDVEDDQASLEHKTYRWNLEDQQRESIFRGLEDAGEEDLVAIGDIDEFYRLDALKRYEEEPFCAYLVDHYYYLNGQRIGNDFMPCSVLLKKKYIGKSISDIRNSFRWTCDAMPNAGWHFSYVGGIEKIIKKIENFSHSEFDKPQYKDPQNIEDIVTKGEDLFGRSSHTFRYVNVQDNNLYDDKIKSIILEYPQLMKEQKNKICLNMIVKDETAIIQNCLKSVIPYIDYYVICDTGSTDDTKEKIKSLMDSCGIDGEIHDIEFRNFEYARNTALKLAHGSDGDFNYILLDDADMILEANEENWKDSLQLDYYLVSQYNELSYHNVRIIKKNASSKYIGVTHEYIDCAGEKGMLNSIKYKDLACGSSRKEKFERDAKLLLEGVEKEENQSLVTRYYFYLGQTYFDMGEYKKAIKHYEERIKRGGWVEEVYFSMYRMGLSYKALGKEETMLHAFLEAYSYHPGRIETIYELSSYYRQKSKFFPGYMFAKTACSMDLPEEDLLFVGKDIYEFRRWDELSICAYWVGMYEESKNICEQLLNNDVIPADQIQRVKDNLKFAEEKCKT
jgi:tetratricopeptide (TPR) repeat protein